jgi:hypothetical protein
MRLAYVGWSLLLVIATAAAASPKRSVTPPAQPAFRGVAYFEAPRSVGTPLAEIAKEYAGVSLADRISGRLRLDTDSALSPVTRELIRRHLAVRN